MTVFAPGDEARVVSVLKDAAARAGTADELLACVAGVLEQRFALCRVSVRSLVVGTSEVEVVALWSRRPSNLGVGVRMPLRSTTLAAVLATGRTQLGVDVQPSDGLLHQLLASEGIHSYASAPLGDVSAGAPVLSLSSTRPDAFSDADLPLVEAVGAVVGARIAKL